MIASEKQDQQTFCPNKAEPESLMECDLSERPVPLASDHEEAARSRGVRAGCDLSRSGWRSLMTLRCLRADTRLLLHLVAKR